MDFFKMMEMLDKARNQGKRAWKRLRKWLRSHPSHRALPGGFEVSLEVSYHLDRRWREKK